MRQQTLNKNLNVPLYVQLKELILNDIQSGTLSAGDMIPTEHELMEQYSISRNVVRQAIGELVEGGAESRHRHQHAQRKDHGDQFLHALIPPIILLLVHSRSVNV